MKRGLIISLLLLSICVKAERRALIIGIGAYPDVDYGWHIINGDNDVLFAQEIARSNGFASQQMMSLVNGQATFQAITQAFHKLIQESLQGDLVYIHFSGHGQQITDLDGDEEDGYDEAWIPYDALQEPSDTYHGERHITDDLLNAWLKQLRAKVGKTGAIIVVSDACHSGTATRNISDTSVIRGTSASFKLSAQQQQYTKPRDLEWLSISSCSDTECNRQTKAQNGKPCGSLTYALYLLRTDLSHLTIEQLPGILKETVNKLVPRPQTPQVEYPYDHNQPLFP